ncbi:hypothetical protein CEXT_207181, partial [Caerostris extrusa]
MLFGPGAALKSFLRVSQLLNPFCTAVAHDWITLDRPGK